MSSFHVTDPFFPVNFQCLRRTFSGKKERDTEREGRKEGRRERGREGEEKKEKLLAWFRKVCS
jgi:hypothetical protein